MRFGEQTENVISDDFAEPAIRGYVRQILESEAKVVGFEIGNEFNIWAGIDPEVYGRVASEIAIAIKAEIDDYEAQGNLPEGYETPLISSGSISTRPRAGVLVMAVTKSA